MWVPLGLWDESPSFSSPGGSRLVSRSCPGLDSAPSQAGRSKAAHSQRVWIKTFDGLLLVAPGEPPQLGTPPSQLVFQVGDSFLKLSQSLIFAVVLASSRQTSVSSASVSSRMRLVATWRPRFREIRVALGFFSLLGASHVICLCSETPRLILRHKSDRSVIAG